MFSSYPDVMDVQDIMAILKIGRHAVYALIKTNKLKGFIICNSYRITKKSLIQYINTMNQQEEIKPQI